MRSILLSALLLAPLAAAQTVQDLWTFPEAPDYTTNITLGTTVELRWQPDLNDVFGIFCTECDITDVDLWATGTTTSALVKSGINLETTHSYRWRVTTFDASDVKSSPAFNLRFIPAGAKWDGTGGQEVSSPQFNILAAASSSTSSSSSSTTPSASATETPSTPSSSPTSSTSSTSSAAATESAEATATTDETTTPASSTTPDATPTDNSAVGVQRSAGVVALGAIVIGTFILV
ncbi:hypothetical protein BJX66DRAFT_302313 [Aspergillus keveii]|uniref:Ser-Thr-rich glycosyl-phosphatidyl-inositol-anchored membrane family-domain-containing protein n=1 Tax=Aspergillus keveii TaxID=714993 RepID=A0ABR4G7Y9_9EURO